MLTIADVDPCIAENGVNHRTSRYDLMTRQDDKSRLVVRRGQEFYLHLTLSRDYEPSIDGMSIIFTVDGVERPLYGHGTLVATAVLYPGEPSEGPWHATIDAIQHNFIRLKVSDQRRIVFHFVFHRRGPNTSDSSFVTFSDCCSSRRDNRQVEDRHRHQEQEFGRSR